MHFLVLLSTNKQKRCATIVVTSNLSFLFPLFSQINIESVEDLDSIYEELLGMPLLLRIWAEHVVQNAEGENATKWEGQSNILFNLQFETTLFKFDMHFFISLH